MVPERTGIHMSPIPSLPYELRWGERVLRSVANLTPEVHAHPLDDADRALDDLRQGRFTGAAVLHPGR